MRSHTLKSMVSRSQPRQAFTLIELIVVIGIVLLLATMTLLALNSFDSERVRSGARQLQSMLEGARNRAILAGQPRGVRFLVENDPLNGRKCSSMIYIGSSDAWSKGTITLMRSDFNFDGVVDNIDRDGDGQKDTEVYMVEGSPETLWDNLFRRGYLPVYEIDSDGDGILDPNEDLNGNGTFDQLTARIKIPGDRNGTWYNISTYHLGRVASHPQVFELIPLRPYRDPGTTPSTEVVAFEGTGANTYVLELPARVLPDVEPALLPGDVTIDLDASSVPVSWRPSAATLNYPYSSQMDILFSPRGTVTGPEAATGLIHFYLCLKRDVDALSSGITSNGESFPLRSPMTGSTWNSNAVIPGESGATTDPPVGERALVTLFTHTGKIGSYPLNAVDTTAPAGFADTPFSYATRGEGLAQ